MIPIALAPEPSAFNEEVRQKGCKFFATHGIPTKSEHWKGHEYWCKSADDLYEAYGHVCAYLCCHIPRQAMTVDHARPKDTFPRDAYEWNNLLPCTSGMNSRKSNMFVLHPFDTRLKSDSFVLNLYTGAILPNPRHSQQHRDLCQDAIDELGLDDDSCRKMRREEVQEYEQGTPESLIQTRYPFVYQEIVRQGWKRDNTSILALIFNLMAGLKGLL